MADKFYLNSIYVNDSSLASKLNMLLTLPEKNYRFYYTNYLKNEVKFDKGNKYEVVLDDLKFVLFRGDVVINGNTYKDVIYIYNDYYNNLILNEDFDELILLSKDKGIIFKIEGNQLIERERLGRYLIEFDTYDGVLDIGNLRSDTTGNENVVSYYKKLKGFIFNRFYYHVNKGLGTIGDVSIDFSKTNYVFNRFSSVSFKEKKRYGFGIGAIVVKKGVMQFRGIGYYSDYNDYNCGVYVTMNLVSKVYSLRYIAESDNSYIIDKDGKRECQISLEYRTGNWFNYSDDDKRFLVSISLRGADSLNLGVGFVRVLEIVKDDIEFYFRGYVYLRESPFFIDSNFVFMKGTNSSGLSF